MTRERPLILCIETATRAGSVAVTHGATLLASRTGDATRSHSSDLLEHVAGALEEAGHRLQDVDLFAVATGPGSFTGLRIGLATVKSFSSTLSRPAAGVPTLEAVARAGGPSKRTVALLPAGRGEVFAQSFKVDEGGEVAQLDEAAHVAPAVLLERVSLIRDLRWVGEGAHLHRELIKERALDLGVDFSEAVDAGDAARGWTLAPPIENLAESVARLAFERYERGLARGAEDLHAIYVRPSDAELKEKCQS